MKLSLFLLFVVLLIQMTACTPEKKVNPVEVFFADTKTKTPAVRQVPSAAVTDALVPDFNQTLSVKPLNPKGLMNISVNELNARDFFMGLVVDSNVNMVVHPEVSGTVSLELKNVTVAQILDTVQKTYGYDYKKTEIGYIIYPATMQTKTFKVDRLALRRLGTSNTSVTSGQSNNNNNNNNSGNSLGNQNNNQGLQNSGNQGGSQNANNNQNTNNQFNQNNANQGLSGSSVSTVTETDFWTDLGVALNSIIGLDRNGAPLGGIADPTADNHPSIAINRQSGLVVVRAKPMQLREIENFLSATDDQIGRQVLLEAKILEVTLNSSHQDGVDWSVLVKQGSGAIGLVTGYGVVNQAAAGFKTMLLPVINTVTGATQAAGNYQSFTAAVEALDKQGKTNVLSSPRIATLNNQPAIIKVGRDEYFITNIYQGSTTSSVGIGGTVNSNPIPSFSQFFSGISLDVTPQINDNNEISLHIHPSITRVTNEPQTYTINGQNNTLPLAVNVVRESDSIVKAQDGQIIVLGGLMQDIEVEDKAGIFGLARIPYLGNLFRINDGRKEKIELIILLKATLIGGGDNSDWQNDINATRQRFDKMEATPQWK